MSAHFAVIPEFGISIGFYMYRYLSRFFCYYIFRSYFLILISYIFYFLSIKPIIPGKISIVVKKQVATPMASTPPN